MTCDPALTERRRDWLAVLARAPREDLARHAQVLAGEPFEWLRAPEVGLAMLRARVGQGGDRFNLGEATITRCAVRHRGANGLATLGLGYVIGRDEERARWVAGFDALLQQAERHARLTQRVIEPLHAAARAAREAQAAQTAASRVRFFTLAAEPAG
jgi:alpha-D-ribose 1-methylphosphonate 5-triphosphate synthase subunit PhnG